MMQGQLAPDAMTIEAWQFAGAAFVVLVASLLALIRLTKPRNTP